MSRAFPFLAAPDLAVPHVEAALARLDARTDPENCRRAEAELRRIEARASSCGGILPLLDLRTRYALDETDATLLLAAARPQLQGAERRRVLTVGELVDAHWADPVERAVALDHLAVHARLRRHRLIELWTVSPHLSEHAPEQQALSPPRVAAYLQGRLDLGTGLHQAARLLLPDAPTPAAPWTESPDATLLRTILERWSQGESPRPLVIGLVGDAGSGKTLTVQRLARDLGRPVVELDAAFLEALEARTAVWVVREVYAAAELLRAWVAVDRPELLSLRSAALQALRRCLDEAPVASLLLSVGSLPPDSGLPARVGRRFFLGLLAEAQRAQLWAAQLQAGEAATPDRSVLQGLATRFELSPAQVRHAVQGLQLEPGLTAEAAATHQLRCDPGTVVRVRRVNLTFDDLVLPPEETELVQEVLRACRHHFELLHRWGFKERLPYGNGIVCLFSGEPGTGKTLCAQILAHALDRDLFQVSLPQILSKWVGETEKQIARVFHEAKAAGAILLFDEADSLLGARTEVQSSADRFANISTNFLLQEIEAFEGVVVLTTNLEENLDSAAARRILFRLHFPAPDVKSRAKLWQILIPRQAKVGRDIDFAALAEQFELSGGHIKNAVVRAAYEALARNRSIGMGVLVRAATRECRANGKLVQDPR